VTVHPRTGRLWTSEYGPRGDDEINEVEKGKNYGFPVIGYGRDYTGKPINGDKTVHAGSNSPCISGQPRPPVVCLVAGVVMHAPRREPGLHHPVLNDSQDDARCPLRRVEDARVRHGDPSLGRM
jgi:Glucose / Sorbosone dehydrogenase